MSSRDTEPRVVDDATLRERLEAYYARYYRGALGIPQWRELVAIRLADTDYERGRLARLEQALGRSVPRNAVGRPRSAR